MRGSIHYQTGELAKVLFMPGMSKYEQKVTGFIANAKTLATYREVWNELGIYVKEHFTLKDLQELKDKHITHYWNDPTILDTLETVKTVDNDRMKQREENIIPWQINYIQTSSNKRLSTKL